MLFKKIISSILMLSLTGLAIFCFPNWVFLILVIGYIALGMHEFFGLIEAKGLSVYKYFGMIAGCLIPVSIYLHLGENRIDLEAFLIVIACLFAFVLEFIKREDSKEHVLRIAVTLFGLFYISWFFSFFMKLKFLENGNNLILFLVLVTKSGDVAAYVMGRLIGRHKLIPRISPKKTIEGTVSGFFASVAVAFFAGKFAGITLGHALVLGVFLGVLAQVGDLAESLIKRDCNVKDAGNTLSGFGGVLDMMDSLLFTAPLFYFYVKILL